MSGISLWWKVTLVLAVTVAGIAMQAAHASAASIHLANSPHCILKLTGPIEVGDFEKFLVQARAHFPGNDGESTQRDVICLNSPGGSAAEGVKFAHHFYTEGVGTYIEEGDGCYSACAIMFMMGLAQGGEVKFPNRQLHVRSELGFHRPYLNPELDGKLELEAAEIAQLYDIAVQRALDLIELGNRKSPWSTEPMMKSDLIQEMLMHRGDEMFLIDTIDKVGRFELDVVGLVTPNTALTEAEAFYACENSLQWKVALTTEDITFTREVAVMGDVPRVEQLVAPSGRRAFSVTGLAAGDWPEHCIIAETAEGIGGCGIDGANGVEIGQSFKCDLANFEDALEPIPAYARYHPWTKLASLPRKAPPSPTVQMPVYRCIVKRLDTVLDDEMCTASIRSLREENGAKLIHTDFIWPSGSKTVLRRSGSRSEVNGVETALRLDRQHGTCFYNTQTGNDFCITRLLTPN